MWTADKLIAISVVHPFRSNVIDFDSQPRCWAGSAFDYVHYSVPRKGLDDIAEDLGFGQASDYCLAVLEDDLVVAQITKSILPFLGRSEAGSRHACSHEEVPTLVFSAMAPDLPLNVVQSGFNDQAASHWCVEVPKEGLNERAKWLTESPHSRATSRRRTSSLTSKSRTDVSGCVRKASTVSQAICPSRKRSWFATQCVPAPDLFNAKVGGTAWKSKPSWYIVAKNDRTVHPDLERFFAKRMGAKVTEVASSHVAMLSHPDVVIDVIRAAAKAVQETRAAA